MIWLWLINKNTISCDASAVDGPKGVPYSKTLQGAIGSLSVLNKVLKLS